MSEDVTSPSEAARIPLASAERFRVSIHYGDAVVSVQVDKQMNVARACAVIVKKTACKAPDNHALVATWYRVPSVIQARTLQPSEPLGAAMEALPSCDGIIELYFHNCTRPFHVTLKDFSDDPSRDLRLLRCGTMLLFGSLYKLSSRDSSHIVWRRMFCVLQESALLWYCGWAHGWRGCALAAAAVSAVEPTRHPLLSRLPYTSTIANTCFEIATPQKSYLFHTKDFSSKTKWFDTLFHAINNATDNNDLALAECVISDQSTTAAARCDTALSVLYKCGAEVFVRHPLCAGALFSHFQSTSGPPTPTHLKLLVDALLFKSIGESFRSPGRCTKCLQCYLVTIRRFAQEAARDFPDMPSALELGLAEGDLVDSKLASSLHVAMELLSYVVDKTMKLVDTGIASFRKSKRFLQLLQSLQRDESADGVPSPSLSTLLPTSSDDRELWFNCVECPVGVCSGCGGPDLPSPTSRNGLATDAVFYELLDNLPSAVMIDAAVDAGWLDDEDLLDYVS